LLGAWRRAGIARSESLEEKKERGVGQVDWVMKKRGWG
jgi:hypothetical protein